MTDDNKDSASVDDEKQKEIASKGGRSQGQQNNPANFANDPEKASEAGQNDGQNNTP